MLDASESQLETLPCYPTARERDHEYNVSHFEDKLYITTNWNAKNFRLMETTLDKPGKENWKEVIAHQGRNAYLEGIEIFQELLGD